MESWTRGAVEKISLMLKVSVCEAEAKVSPAVERRSRLNDRVEQASMMLKTGRKSAASSCSRWNFMCPKQSFNTLVDKLQTWQPDVLVRRERAQRKNLNQQ